MTMAPIIVQSPTRGIIRFSPALTLDPVPGKLRRGRQIYRVRARVTVRINGSYLVHIEQGFETDLTSWPWWGRWRCWRDDPRFIMPAVLHDHLLETTVLPKREVDWLYLGALLSCGAPALCAFLFWSAVRWKRTRL